jgi:hypothetical protein
MFTCYEIDKFLVAGRVIAKGGRAMGKGEDEIRVVANTKHQQEVKGQQDYDR